MKTLKVGIIGCGNMGRRHARAYRYHEPVTNLVACYDIQDETARGLGGEFGCAVDGSLDELLARPEIQAVSICTTEAHHVEPVVKAARAGKHILLEKPMAMDLDQAAEMKRAVDSAGVTFMVAHLFRFDQRCAEVKRLIDSGRLGEVVSVDCRFHGTPDQQDRVRDVALSIFVFRGCHGIDLMRWYTGSEPVRVYAESLEGQLAQKGYQSEDAVFCLMRFASGAVGSIEINSHVPKGHPTAGRAELTVIGTQGMVEIDLATPWLTIAEEDRFTLSQGNQKDLWFREEIEVFSQVVLQGADNIATADDAVAALKISLAAVQSAGEHRPVLFREE
jgi:predicted dehydrogenase